MQPEYNYFWAVVPSDTLNEPQPFDAIYVGVPGIVVVVRSDGTAVTLTGCLAGRVYPVRGIRINNTTTTATDMVALKRV